MRNAYVELQAVSHFSFLRGASSPEELFAAAALLGYPALGIADHGSVAGLVHAWAGEKATNVRLVAGARVDLEDGPPLLLYPADRPAWSRLTRLLTLGKRRFGKGGCTLCWDDLPAYADGLFAVMLPDVPGEATTTALERLRGTYGKRAHMALALRRRPDDLARLHALDDQARSSRVRSVVTGWDTSA